MSEVRVVDLKELGVSKEVFDKIYSMGEQDGRADAIKDFAEWLPKNFDLRFSNNPNVWVDEYFNHTREKVLEQLKEQTEWKNK